MTIKSAFTDLSDTGPNMLFNTGAVENNQEQYNSVLPNAPGGTDTGWSLTQWSTDQFLNPAVQSAPVNDPVLGQSVANWTVGDQSNLSGLTVFGTPGNYIYRLTDNGGNLKDVFLQNIGYAPNDFTFDHQITFTANEGISNVTNSANSGGTTVAGNCFTVAFNKPGTSGYDPSLPVISMFLQVPLVDQRGIPNTFDTSIMYDIVPNANNQNDFLTWQSDGTLHQVSIDLNSAVSEMVSWMMAHSNWDSRFSAAGNALTDMSKWTLSSVFVGPESISSGLSMDVSHLGISMDTSKSFSYENANTNKIVTISGGVDYAQASAGLVSTTDGSSTPAMPATHDYQLIDNNFLVTDNTSDAVIDNSADITNKYFLFANNSSFTYSGGNTTIVTAGSNSTPITINSNSEGGNLIWASGTQIIFKGINYDHIVMNATAGDNGSIKLLNSGSSTALTEIDSWGSVGTTSTIDNTAGSKAIIFGGTSDISYSGSNSTIVLGDAHDSAEPTGVVWYNNNPPTGANLTVTSNGNNTVWAGDTSVILNITDNAQGKDQIIMGGGNVVINGSSSTENLSIDDKSAMIAGARAGNLTYNAGAETLTANIGDTASTIYGGSGNETINLMKTGSLQYNGGSSSGNVNLTVFDSAGLSFIGGSGADNISLANGSSTITAGIGSMLVNGGAGNFSLDFASAIKGVLNTSANSGNVDVFNFNSSSDSVNMIASSIADIHHVSGGTQIDLTNGNHVLFHGITSLDGINTGGVSYS